MSLFERLMEAGSHSIYALAEQYRMDLTISAVVNYLIYRGTLSDGLSVVNNAQPSLREVQNSMASLSGGAWRQSGRRQKAA